MKRWPTQNKGKPKFMRSQIRTENNFKLEKCPLPKYKHVGCGPIALHTVCLLRSGIISYFYIACLDVALFLLDSKYFSLLLNKKTERKRKM